MKPENLYKKSIPVLLKLADKKFNAFIRYRDENMPCISCNEHNPLQAGHFFSKNITPRLRYNEDNVHGECLKCNYFNENHLINYQVNLETKIGTERLNKLREIAENKTPYKWDKEFLIDIIKKY